jgi:translation initiation factor 1A
MPGAHKKKRSKHTNVAEKARDVVFRDEDQMYARALNALGAARFKLMCEDGVERVGRLRGNMRKSDWVATGTIVIVSKRDFGGGSGDACCKVDILHRYPDSHVQYLTRYGALDWLKPTTTTQDEELVVFEDVDDI